MSGRFRIPGFLAGIVVIASLALAAPIHDAVRAGDPVRLEKEIKSAPGSVNAVDNGKSPLALAVEKKDLRLIEVLVAAGANDKQDLAAAYDLYAAKLRSNPSDVGVNFIAGLMSYRLEDYGRGMMEFDRVIARNPANASARAHAGLCYFGLKQYEQAEEAFREARHGQLPGDIAEAIDGYLERIEKMTDWSFYGTASVGISHDSNLNVGPDHETISIAPVTFYNIITINAIDLAEESLPQAAYVAEGAASIGAHRRLTKYGGVQIFGRADHYQSFASDQSDYDVFLGQVVAGVRAPTGWGMWQVPVLARHAEFGYSPLTTTYGILPAVSYSAGNWRLSTELSISQQDWNDADERDGTYVVLREKGLRRLGSYTVQLLAEIAHDATDSDVYTRSGLKLGITGSRDLPLGIKSVLGYTASIDEYDEPSVLEADARGDQGHDIVFVLTRPIFENARISLRHVHRTNTSSFDLYDYTRDITTLITSISF